MAKGSVRKKGKKWYYRFYIEDESGNRVQKEYPGTESKSETEALLRKAMENYETTLFIAKAKNVTVGALLDCWLEEEISGSSRASGTVHDYANIVSIIKRHPIGKRKLQTVKPEHLQKFFDELCSGKSYGRIYSFTFATEKYAARDFVPVKDANGTEVPHCYLAIGAGNRLQLQIVPNGRVETAVWKGVRGGDLADPANWGCTTGGQDVTGVPMALTHVTIRDVNTFVCTNGAPFACADITLDALGEDTVARLLGTDPRLWT